ncbi:MAG: class I SAM-dependent methyltransferase [Candidatus Cloacimonetes bacterium]|nr:class I SAM-dependent methyltransferase [Candidatus Cloacimonadota bacterium]
MNQKNNKVCPVEMAGGLDNILRRIAQNPQKILKPYIKPGMSVLDLGCGPGFFTVEIAKLLNGSGKVIAADLQQGMLDKITCKIAGSGLENQISLHKCKEDTIGVSENVDFILAFYMIHEVPDQKKLFTELVSILNAKGEMLIVEPNFHVSENDFKKMLQICEVSGFSAIAYPKSFMNRSVLLKKNKH